MTVSTLIFDLDNTLYPASAGIWDLIRQRIDLFMTEKLKYDQADVCSARDKLYREYGTTLRGLQSLHHIDPEEYLKFVHAVPLQDNIYPDPILKDLLRRLPQKKVIFTNADRWHTERVLKQLDISQEIDQIVDVLDVLPYCKPMESAYQKAFAKMNIYDPTTCVMFEDSLENLKTAKRLGMKTVYINEQTLDQTEWMQLNYINQLEQIIMNLIQEEGYA